MMKSKRFYFFRAWYEWITDNELTAYIIADAKYPNIIIPKDYVQDGRITLNISPQAVNDFKMTHRLLEFEADFDPPLESEFISVPINAIIAIYANENGEGTLFPDEEVVDRDQVAGAEDNQQHEKRSELTNRLLSKLKKREETD